MRGRLLNMPAIGRAVGFALVAIAIVAAALHFRTRESHVQGPNVSPATASDPLTAELQRCQVLATQAKDDASTAKTLGIIGIVVGALGLVAGGAGLAMARGKRVG